MARNGKAFARGLEDGTIEVWETETFRIVATLPHNRRVRALAFSPSGRTLATISKHDREVTLWDLDRGIRRLSFLTPASQPSSLAYSRMALHWPWVQLTGQSLYGIQPTVK